MEVLSGVASEYLLNVGRTIQYLSNKYAKKMTPEVCSFLLLSVLLLIYLRKSYYTLFLKAVSRALTIWNDISKTTLSDTAGG